MNLFFLVHQLDTTLGLRVIDNGLGFPVYGGEDAMVDYALLADDQKSTLPSKVQHRHYHMHRARTTCQASIVLLIFTNHEFSILELPYSVHHLLVCDCGCFADQHLLLPTSPPVWESLDCIHHGSSTWQQATHFQTDGKIIHVSDKVSS